MHSDGTRASQRFARGTLSSQHRERSGCPTSSRLQLERLCVGLALAAGLSQSNKKIRG